MFVGKDNIRRDINKVHYRFKLDEDIVMLLGIKHMPEDVESKDNFVNMKDTDIFIKGVNKWVNMQNGQ